MKILHTSDWHIGRSFHGHATLVALTGVLDVLVEQVREHRVDAVIVAGDVFDSATPSADAYTALTKALTALADTGAQIIVTSGNHDNAARLGFQAPLLRDGVHVLTDPLAVGEPITLCDEHGPVQIFGIPYLEPAIVRHRFDDAASGGIDLRTQAQTMTFAMDRVRAGIARNPGRSVAVAHCFAAGVEATPGVEREVRQGTLDVVPLSSFDGPDYVALGHIHGRQTLSERVRYAGAPLHYSFGEQHKERGSWLVELDAGGLASVEWLSLPVPRRLTTVRGTLDELLTDPRFDADVDAWVCAEYTDAVIQQDPMRRLRDRFPFCATVVHAPERVSTDDGRSYAQRLRSAVTDEDRLDAFLRHVRGGEGPTDAERALIREVVEEAVRAEALA